MIDLNRIWGFLTALGLGLVVALVGNDAGSVVTYAVAGAGYGYKLLWLLLFAGISLVMIQEMAFRLGAVTGKTLSDLMREELGVRWTFFAVLVLFVANFCVTVANFAGLSAACEIFETVRYLSIPVSAVLLCVLVFRGGYLRVERFFAAGCGLGLIYLIAGFLSRPAGDVVLRYTFLPYFEFNLHFIWLALAVLGATLTPWLQFYLQSAVVERRAQLQSYNLLRLEVMLGTGAALLVAYFIILASATTIHLSGVRLYEVKDAAQALGPLLGGGAGWYFGLFLFMVSFLGLAMVPLSTAYAFCRAFGLENGTNKKFNEAPVFFIIFTALLAGSAVFVLLFRGVFLQLMVAAQVMNGLLVPFMLVFMLRLTNNKKLMGHSANSTFYNVIVGGLIGFSFVLVLMLLIYTFG